TPMLRNVKKNPMRICEVAMRATRQPRLRGPVSGGGGDVTANDGAIDPEWKDVAESAPIHRFIAINRYICCHRQSRLNGSRVRTHADPSIYSHKSMDPRLPRKRT